MYVYILLCSDKTYYVGVTNNLERGFAQHQEGIHPECYTFLRRSVELKFPELFNNALSAIAFEKKIKKWSKVKKEALISKNYDLLHSLSKKKFKQ